MENKFLDAIERDGIRPDATKFERRGNFTANSINTQAQGFQSIDGRRFERKDQVFQANKEYYQKMFDKSKNSFKNI